MNENVAATNDTGATAVEPTEAQKFPPAGADNRNADVIAQSLYSGNQAQEQPEQVSETQNEPVSPDSEAGEVDNQPEQAKVTPDLFKDYVENGLVSEEVAAQFAEWANEVGLDAEQAQAVAKLQLASQQATIKAVQEQVAQWEDQVKNDPEIGGDKLPETLATAKRGVEMVGIDGLMEWLDQTGLGSHPMVIKLFHKIGQTLGEAPTVKSKDGAQPEEKSIAEILYSG